MNASADHLRPIRLGQLLWWHVEVTANNPRLTKRIDEASHLVEDLNIFWRHALRVCQVQGHTVDAAFAYCGDPRVAYSMAELLGNAFADGGVVAQPSLGSHCDARTSCIESRARSQGC